MILADSSAWIEYDHATGSAVDRRMTELVPADVGPLAVTEPVVMEVLLGARSQREEDALTRLLGRYRLLPFDASADFVNAARIYRRCRVAGGPPPTTVHCVIASVAMRAGAALLSADPDLTRIAEVVGIELDTVP